MPVPSIRRGGQVSPVQNYRPFGGRAVPFLRDPLALRPTVTRGLPLSRTQKPSSTDYYHPFRVLLVICATISSSYTPKSASGQGNLKKFSAMGCPSGGAGDRPNGENRRMGLARSEPPAVEWSALRGEWRNGRRYGLKIRWGRPHVGSIPTSPTTFGMQRNGFYTVGRGIPGPSSISGFVQPSRRRRQVRLEGATPRPDIVLSLSDSMGSSCQGLQPLPRFTGGTSPRHGADHFTLPFSSYSLSLAPSRRIPPDRTKSDPDSKGGGFDRLRNGLLSVHPFEPG